LNYQCENGKAENLKADGYRMWKWILLLLLQVSKVLFCWRKISSPRRQERQEGTAKKSATVYWKKTR